MGKTFEEYFEFNEDEREKMRKRIQSINASVLYRKILWSLWWKRFSGVYMRGIGSSGINERK